VRRRSPVKEITDVFAEIPTDIKQFASEVKSYLECTSSQAFLLSLLNEVNEQNWLIRDQFKEWKITLEQEIHHRIAPGQTRHLLDLDRTACSAMNILEPFAQAAVHYFAEDEEEREEDSKEEKEPKKSPSKKPEFNESEVKKAQQFVSKEKHLFRDTALSANSLIASLKFTRETCAQLNEFFRHQSEERQNDTLKLLTVITSTVLPMQLSTGVFGMNFELMPELGWDYSYLLFWVINIFVILLILWFWRQRGFI